MFQMRSKRFFNLEVLGAPDVGVLLAIVQQSRYGPFVAGTPCRRFKEVLEERCVQFT